jgi:RND family efflux transporter MFP subunit
MSPAPAAPTVEFVHPLRKKIISWNEFNGRLEAVESIEVRARVGGMLEKVHFTDGQNVNIGDLLFTIDSKPFAAEAKAARANLHQAEAAMKLARSNFERSEELLQRNAVAREEVETRSGLLAQAEARVEAAQAMVETAELNLGYTEVRSPIAGRIADRFVSPGNLISGGSEQSTLLTTIMSIDPIYCRIDADEASVLDYERHVLEGSRADARTTAIPGEMALEGDQGFPRKGHLNFVSNTFDTATATLRARVIFPNEDGFLTPGMFAKVRLPDRGEYTATLIPELAIRSQQDLVTVFTLDSENIVRSVPIILGPKHGEMRVIESELPDETRILISGLTHVRTGQTVTPKPAAPTDAR